MVQGKIRRKNKSTVHNWHNTNKPRVACIWPTVKKKLDGQQSNIMLTIRFSVLLEESILGVGRRYFKHCCEPCLRRLRVQCIKPTLS